MNEAEPLLFDLEHVGIILYGRSLVPYAWALGSKVAIITANRYDGPGPSVVGPERFSELLLAHRPVLLMVRTRFDQFWIDEGGRDGFMPAVMGQAQYPSLPGLVAKMRVFWPEWDASCEASDIPRIANHTGRAGGEG